MNRFLFAFVCALSLAFAPVLAQAGEKAAAFREANQLIEFKPPQSFLDGFFAASESKPGFIFGSVADFAKSQPCQGVWLIEKSEAKRVEQDKKPGKPFEYTLYLEADCKDGLRHYVFVDQSGLTPQQWIDWRQQFHKSKAAGEYGQAKDKLEDAAKAGYPVSAELRFIVVEGELGSKVPEKALIEDLKFAPRYDVEKSQALSK